MEKIRTIVIDDEQHCTDRLCHSLEDIRSANIEGTFSDVESGIEGIRQIAPDLVFLDVMLGDETGFDLLQKLDQYNFELIFTTAYDKFAVKAFKFSALDYLLKPIDSDDLKQSMNRVATKIAKNHSSDRIETLLHNLEDIRGTSKRIAVPSMDGLTFIDTSDIIRCQSCINYTTLHLSNRQTLLVTKTLKEFEEMLVEYNFFRVHNSHLINLGYVSAYNKGKGGYLTMTDNSEVEVSTRRKSSFMKILRKI